jgi:hypothetical protein
MIFVVAALVGAAFGAADQYLGSLRSMVALGPWTVSVSQMSAFWLLLPFAFGCTQERPRRAVLIGLTATLAALFGYLALTISPIEGVALHAVPGAAAGWLRSNTAVVAGGLITGPTFGWLGQRWRAERWWVSLAVVSGSFLLEPLARGLGGRLLGPAWAWIAEAAVGACLAGLFVATGFPRRRGAVG